MHQPKKPHIEAARRILKYLKGTRDQGPHFKRNNHTHICTYSDTDWARSIDDRWSTTGYCCYVGGNLVSWKSKKQSVVSRSSAKSEYHALTNTICEVMWMKYMLEKLSFQVNTPLKIFCDSKATIHINNNPVYHERTKHFEIDCHFIREKVMTRLVNLVHVSTKDQVADILIKVVPRDQFIYLLKKMGLYNSSCRSWRGDCKGSGSIIDLIHLLYVSYVLCIR